MPRRGHELDRAGLSAVRAGRAGGDVPAGGGEG